MWLLRARVQGGQLIAEAPTGLEEGAVVDVAVVQEAREDDATPPDRDQLDAAINEAHDSYLRGEAVDAAVVLAELDRPA